MNADEIVEQINERQKELTKENKKYYENMLIYVRLSFDKSERETEEFLAEILDHILIAQEEGRSAVDVFGDDPKEYLHEAIGELPKMVTKKQSNMFVMIILYFLASAITFYPILGAAIYIIFGVGDLYKVIHIGSGIIITVISIAAAFFCYMLSHSCLEGSRSVK